MSGETVDIHWYICDGEGDPSCAEYLAQFMEIDHCYYEPDEIPQETFSCPEELMDEYHAAWRALRAVEEKIEAVEKAAHLIGAGGRKHVG